MLLAVATLVLLFWTAATQAVFGIDYHAKAAYFNYGVNGNSLYVFALNAVANGDVYFHMSGPNTHSWLGVGFGSEMQNSFMIIAYAAANGHNTTISARIGTGHTEPVYTPDFEILKIYNDTYAPNANIVVEDTGVIIAHAVCKNCSRWATGFLDTKSKAQPMLFALGPNQVFQEDSPAAGLPRHAEHGTYTLDMTQATNYSGWYGRVPAPNVPEFVYPPDDSAFASFATTPSDDVATMSNPLPTVHGVLMCFAFVILFPAGAVVMGIMKQALTHAAIQTAGFIFVFAAFGVGVKIAKQYVRSKDFNSAHQIIGLIILLGLLIQLGLGLIHHAMYARTQKPTPFGRVHFFLGPFIMLLGLINAGVGFHFAGNSHLNIPYGAVVGAIVVVLFIILGCWLCLRRRRKYKPQTLEEYQQPDFGFGFSSGSGKDFSVYTDHELTPTSATSSSRQPTFGEEPPLPYEPTTPFSPIGTQFALASPRSPTAPYTPISAYTPATPRTWRKEEITNWPLAPYKEFG